jgi:WD40 repeat protein
VHLVTKSQYGTLKLWDVATGRELAASRFGNFPLSAFSPDSKWLLANAIGFIEGDLNSGPVLQKQVVKLFSVTTGRETTVFQGHHNAGPSVVEFSPDSSKLALGNSDGTIELWDVATGRKLATVKGHTNKVVSLAHSRDGKFLATGGSDRTLKIWDSTTLGEVTTLKGFTSSDKVRSATFSPDKQIWATVSNESVRLLNLFTGKEMTIAAGRLLEVTTPFPYPTPALAFSPDARWLATRYQYNAVKLWDVATGRELNTLKGRAARINALAFTPAGKRLVTLSDDGTVQLGDVATGRELNTLKGHAGEISAFAFTPEGKRLVTVSGDGTARLWDVSTGQELISLKGHGGLRSVSFSPDGKTLATGSTDGTAILWRAATEREVTARRN